MEKGATGIGFGYLGIGFTADANNKDGYLFGCLLNFMYQSEIGLGITASPLTFFINFNDYNNYSLTFVNLSLFYNFLYNMQEYLVLGPFVFIHAIKYDNPGFIEFRSGFRFSLRNREISSFYFKDSMFNSDLLVIEPGYKYNKTTGHGFYVHVGIDLLIALGLLGNKNDIENYYRANKTVDVFK